jgi:muramoyltetrapeptide carboxypeptidase
MQWVADDEVAAVVCARGGYGAQRMVGRLDAARVRRARKPLIGFSDVTTLLLWQLRCAGLAGVHGPMPARDARGADREALLRLLCGESTAPRLLRGTPRGGGRGEGRLVGGNLTVLAASLACPWEIETRGAVLLLEDVGERPYRLDRVLSQLSAAGKLAGLAGVGVGCFAACDDPSYPQPAAFDVLEELLRPLGVPLVTGLPFGHGEENVPWPFGVRARIDGDAGTVEWLGPAVAVEPEVLRA